MPLEAEREPLSNCSGSSFMLDPKKEQGEGEERGGSSQLTDRV